MPKLQDSDELTKEQKQAILDERAAFLAQTPLASAQKDKQLEVLEVVIEKEKFALEARFVREASKVTSLTRLPCTPDFVLGLINFRGQILPLIDLRNILELPARNEKSELQVVVVQTELAKAGIAVDEITGISSIGESELQSAKQLVSTMMVPLLKGVRADRLAVLDIEKVFADPRLIVEGQP